MVCCCGLWIHDLIQEILFVSSTSNIQNDWCVCPYNDWCVCPYNERALICGQRHYTSFRSIIIIDAFIAKIITTDYHYRLVTILTRLARLCLYAKGDLCCFASVLKQSPVGQGLLIVKASRSHTDTPHSVGLLWTSDRLDAEPSTWQHTTLRRDRHLFCRRNSNSESQQASGSRHTP
jgi:hypothetical protein